MYFNIPIDLQDYLQQEHPSPIVSHKIVQVSESITLALTKGSAMEEQVFINRFSNPKPRVGFNFCIEGKTSFALTGGFPTAHCDNTRLHTFLMPSCEVEQPLTLNPQIELATFYLDARAFMNLLGGSLEVVPRDLLDGIEKEQKCFFEKHRWQPVVRSILSQVFSARFSPLSFRLFIESKTLELLAIILELYTQGNQNQFSISRNDIEKIQYAREILMRDLANPPSLSQLARLASTNEFTLKKGFKEVFNLPVFKYLQQARLTKAYELFQSSNLQVTEVATLVGYESMSSFTKAFSDFFGIRPSEVKRIPFKTI